MGCMKKTRLLWILGATLSVLAFWDTPLLFAMISTGGNYTVSFTDQVPRPHVQFFGSQNITQTPHGTVLSLLRSNVGGQPIEIGTVIISTLIVNSRDQQIPYRCTRFEIPAGEFQNGSGQPYIFDRTKFLTQSSAAICECFPMVQKKNELPCVLQKLETSITSSSFLPGVTNRITEMNGCMLHKMALESPEMLSFRFERMEWIKRLFAQFHPKLVNHALLTKLWNAFGSDGMQEEEWVQYFHENPEFLTKEAMTKLPIEIINALLKQKLMSEDIDSTQLEQMLPLVDRTMAKIYEDDENEENNSSFEMANQLLTQQQLMKSTHISQLSDVELKYFSRIFSLYHHAQLQATKHEKDDKSAETLLNHLISEKLLNTGADLDQAGVSAVLEQIGIRPDAEINAEELYQKLKVYQAAHPLTPVTISTESVA